MLLIWNIFPNCQIVIYEKALSARKLILEKLQNRVIVFTNYDSQKKTTSKRGVHAEGHVGLHTMEPNDIQLIKMIAESAQHNLDPTPRTNYAKTYTAENHVRDLFIGQDNNPTYSDSISTIPNTLDTSAFYLPRITLQPQAIGTVFNLVR
ncbi:uncharacterized protein EAF01_009580 [Botrytis porri]|uniref:uncharacterized protein n=1 Tax=Botrytis porri TaxID=87229 RepID=UPI0018FF7364|nr:uncharacterized protein EAF01_009580 [Botrytis porri]KAF7895618.1 hypothetical protein EAF01_009580 [Botrytis porri]